MLCRGTRLALLVLYMKKHFRARNIFVLGLVLATTSAGLGLVYGAEETNIGSRVAPKSISIPNPGEELLTDDIFSTAFQSTIIKADTTNKFTKEEILADKGNRISDEFAIPPGLEERVSFWFDVYTKYSDKTHIVHHVLYPWVIFKVIDTSPIYETPNLHKWTKFHKAKKFVSQEIASVRVALNKLSKRSNYNNLKGLEKEIFDSLAQVKGPRKKVIREAAHNIRTQLGQRDFFLGGLTSSAKYLPYMEKEFQAAGVPVELARLPFVESSFNEKAFSKVGASGIWQIMPVTGRAYFKVNDLIDERNSPLKASVAAVDIFRSNYKQLKQWPLAVTAYNHGAGGLKANLKRARATNLPDLIRKYHAGSFKFASANFYTCFLAAMHAERYNAEIFPALDVVRGEPMVHNIISLNSSMKINKVIAMSGISKDQFLEYNLDLKGAMKKNAALPRGFKVLVPPIAKKNLEMNLGPTQMKEADTISLSRERKKRG